MAEQKEFHWQRKAVLWPGREGPCFGVCAVVCDFSPKAECVSTFARESKRRAFVREVEKCDEKRFGTEL